ncbi:selenoprotein W-related protein [Prauserella alba]|nr:selenoprotein W-related protein [Prauserella alba]
MRNCTTARSPLLEIECRTRCRPGDAPDGPPDPSAADRLRHATKRAPPVPGAGSVLDVHLGGRASLSRRGRRQLPRNCRTSRVSSATSSTHPRPGAFSPDRG